MHRVGTAILLLSSAAAVRPTAFLVCPSTIDHIHAHVSFIEPTFSPSLGYAPKQPNWASRLPASPIGLTYLLPVQSDSLLVSLLIKTSLSANFDISNLRVKWTCHRWGLLPLTHVIECYLMSGSAHACVLLLAVVYL